jgi:sigma-54 dependent transcriptional regulator, flagellar regulatory protein
MEAAALKIGVIGDDDMEQHALGRIVEFMGHEVSPIEDCHLVMASGKESVRRVPSSTPLLYVGADAPAARNIIANIDHLRLHQMQSAIHEVRTILQEQLTQQGPQRHVLARLLGQSSKMTETRSLLAKVVDRDVPVLLTGESGTGKEFVARTLHAASTRCNRPFVPVNCSAIQAELLEGELFGHERGAFIGALTSKAGRLELADGGTLFLEEPAALDYAMQLKLLRVLQKRAITRVGGDHARSLDIRVVVADQGNLERLVERGEFREDLFYALNVYPVHLAPLRERSEDIPLLIDALCAEIEREQRLVMTLSVDVVTTLGRYAWPGNIRELRTLMQRLALQCRGEVVTTRDLPTRFRETQAETAQRPGIHEVVLSDDPEAVRLPVNGMDLKDYLARLERSLIEQALDDADAVVARAADRLHIRRTTLVEKMRKYGISR